MATKKSYIYEIIIDTKRGTASIDGTAIALDKLEGKIRKVVAESDKFNKNLGQGASKAGLAGAAVTELGRTISDSNYGMTAMANNLQQLSTLFLTLVSTSGGLLNGLKLIGSALLGPLGIIVAFQVLFMWMEKASMQAKKTASVINNVAIAWRNSATELEIIRDKSDDLTDAEIDNIEIRIKNLKEEAKVRAQIAEIQRLQSEQLKLDKSEAQDNLNWWETALIWTTKNLGEFIDEEFKGAQITKGKFRKDLSWVEMVLMGEGAQNREQKSKEIAGDIIKLIDAIDVEVVKRITDKTKKSKDGGKIENPLSFGTTFGDPFEELMKEMEIEGERLEKLKGLRNAELEMERWLNNKLEEEREKKRKAQERADEIALESKLVMLDSVAMGMESLSVIIGKETKAGKALAAAGALIDTYAAITAQLKNASKIGIPGPIAIAQAVATGLFGFAQVKKIYSVNVPNASGGGSGGGGSTPAPPQNPSFNIIGQSRDTQIRDTIEGALGKPIKAYVTTKDIKSGEELDRNTIRGARVG